MRGTVYGRDRSPDGGRRRQGRWLRRARLGICALLATAAGPALFASGADASGSPQGPPAGPTSAPFTQCPAVDEDTSCGYLIEVKSTTAPPTILMDPTQPPYDGDDDITVGVQNETSSPLSSVHLGVNGSGEDIFGFDGDGLCSEGEGISPKPEECPFGPSLENPFDYEGPDTVLTAEPSESVEAGTVSFPTPLQPGQYTYFTLEAELGAATVVTAGEVNDAISTVLTPENTEIEQGTAVPLPAPGNVTDTATIKGLHASEATGKVHFAVYSDAECTIEVADAGEAIVEHGEAKAPKEVGSKLADNATYYWKAVYTSTDPTLDSNAESPCGAETMTFGTPPTLPQPSIATVLSGGGQIGSSITVEEGTSVTDTAIISAPSGQAISGRLSYAAYNNEACFGKPIGSLGGGGSTTGSGPATNAVTLSPGTYYFQAFYSGNHVLNHASTSCGAEVLTVKAKASSSPPPPPPPPPPLPISTFKINLVHASSNGTITIVFVPTQSGLATLTVTVPTASIARVDASAAKSRKCKRSQIKIGHKCLPKTTVSSRISVSGIAGVPLSLTVKPSGKVVNAIKKGKTIVLTVTLTYKSSLGGPASVQVLHFTIKPKHRHHHH
jgi:hypothetical protein